MPAKELARYFTQESIAATDIETTENVSDALRRALSLAGSGDMVYIGGSNFVVGEALTQLRLLITR